VFGAYGFNQQIVFPTFPTMSNLYLPPHPPTGWKRNEAEWLPHHHPHFHPHEDSDEEEDDGHFDNSFCPGGWSGGSQWPCKPMKSCSTLKPRMYNRAYCGWSGGEALVCCPPPDKASIHADNAGFQTRVKPKIQPASKMTLLFKILFAQLHFAR